MKTKKILFICTASLGLLAFTVNQKSSLQVIPEVTNYTDTSKNEEKKLIEVLPEYPGRYDALLLFISKNFNYPSEAKKNKIEGKVLISFVIDENGKTTDIQPLLPIDKQLGYGLEEEAMRVVSIMPDWTPGMNKGKPVKVRYTLPFYCTLDEQIIEDKKEKKKNKK